jgi:hypothetical protein
MWRCFIVICLVLLATFAGCRAKAQKPVLLWSQDLAHDQDFQKRLGQDLIVLRPPTIDFLNAKQIIVAFDDGAISGGGPVSEPFGFHVLEVKADSGSFGKKLSFSVLSDSSQAQVIKGGDLLVLAGEKLQKFSADFQEVSALPTPLRLHGQPTKQVFAGGTYWNPRYERWLMDVAPGGDTVLLGHIEKPLQMHLQWLRTSDFSVTKSLSTHTWKDVLASDNGALFIEPMKAMLLSDDKFTVICNRCEAHFITDDLLFLNEEKAYEIKSLNGEVKARGKLSVYASTFKRAQSASRFAYSTGAYRGYGFPLVTHFPSVHSDIRVYDWKQMKQVAEVDLNKHVGSESMGYSKLAIALSPDGKQLVILDDSKLSCYSLPQ